MKIPDTKRHISSGFEGACFRLHWKLDTSQQSSKHRPLLFVKDKDFHKTHFSKVSHAGRSSSLYLNPDLNSLSIDGRFTH